MIIKAPVGTPICTLLPPKTEIIRPATIAVNSPFSGETPDAMANAMASGKATIPTTTTDKRSFLICSVGFPLLIRVKNLGLNILF